MYAVVGAGIMAVLQRTLLFTVENEIGGHALVSNKVYPFVMSLIKDE